MNTELKIIESILAKHPDATVRKMENLELEEIKGLLSELSVDSGRIVLERMNVGRAIELLTNIDSEVGGRILEASRQNTSTQLLRMLPPSRREQLMKHMPADYLSHFGKILSYPDSTVGAVSDPFVLTLTEDQTVEQVFQMISVSKLSLLPNTIVLNANRTIRGLVEMKRLFKAKKESSITRHCDEAFPTILADMDRDIQYENWKFQIHDVPVVDLDEHFLGMVSKDILIKSRTQAVRNLAAKTTSIALGDLYRVGLSGLFYGSEEHNEEKK